MTVDVLPVAMPEVEIDGGVWRRQAACLGLDPNIFFPGLGNNQGMVRARAICAGCPVRLACLEWALVNRVRDGVYGGKSERERRKMRGRLNRARQAIEQVAEAESA